MKMRSIQVTLAVFGFLFLAAPNAWAQRGTPDPERAVVQQIIVSMAQHIQAGRVSAVDTLFAGGGHILTDTTTLHSWAEYRDGQLKAELARFTNLRFEHTSVEAQVRGTLLDRDAGGAAGRGGILGGRASGEFNGCTSSAASSSAVNHKTTLSRGGRAEHDGTAGGTLRHPPSLSQPDHDDHQRDHEQQVQQAAHGIRGQESQYPEQDEDDCDRPHGNGSSLRKRLSRDPLHQSAGFERCLDIHLVE